MKDTKEEKKEEKKKDIEKKKVQLEEKKKDIEKKKVELEGKKNQIEKKIEKKIEHKYRINWSNVFEIFRNDVKEISSNVAVFVIIIGLSIVPSLYAWFNIKAFWDPYSNTKYLKVAVVNQDKGGVFRDQQLDLGDKVVDELKKNDALDWQFVNERNAEDGLKSGKYYAVIKLPYNFTDDLLSLTEKNVHKATIYYSVNEKVNAVAPKITDRGASTLQMQISQNLVETVGKVSLLAVGGVSNLVGDINPHLDKMKEALLNIDKQLDNMKSISNNTDEATKTLEKSLNNGKGTIASVKKTVSSSKNLNREMKKMLNDANSSFNDIAPNLKKDLEVSSDLFGQTNDLVSDLNSSVGTVSADSLDVLRRINSKLVNGITMAKSIAGILRNLNINSSALNVVIDNIDTYVKTAEDLNRMVVDAASSVERGNDISSSTLGQMNKLSDSLNRQSINLLVNFDDKVKNPINKIHGQSLSVTNALNELMNKTDTLYPEINKLIDNGLQINSSLKSTNALANNSVTILKQQVKDTIDAIDDLQNNKDFEKFNNIIKSNILDRAEFIKDPVEIKEHKVYPIKNYGSAMAPFYSVLACWVGALVLVAIISMSSTKTKKKYRSIDMYFGRMMIFMLLSTVQACIIGFGDFFIIKITAKHPVVFVLLLVLCGITFTAIVYSLVSMFGTVGKGLSVFLLVIQIGGSGGTFPVSMTPHFFRAINAIIPFTYGIDACREAVGGIYMPNLIQDLVALLIFMVTPIVLAVIFKEPINKMGHPMHRMFNDSFIIGH